MPTHTMRIRIISDHVCPWCFIGKRQLDQALTRIPELEVQLVWEPFFLDPDLPREGMDRRSYLTMKFGHPEAMRGIRGRLEEAASGLGLSFARPGAEHRPHTMNAHRITHWAREGAQQHALADAIFCAYFERAENIGDPDLLAELAADVGMDRAQVRQRLAGSEDEALIEERARDNRSGGVGGVPCYDLEGFMLPGAQDPETIAQLLRRILRKRES